MPHPLDGPKTKLDRARVHFQALVDESDRFIGTTPYGLIQRYDSGTRELRFQHQVRADPDLVAWGTLIGDCVHNLRAAFDHLAWQLVMAKGNKPDRYTRFPVYSGDPKRYESETHLMVRGMSGNAKALIEDMQPYRSGSVFDQNWLYALDALDREDKHRLLVVVGGAALTANFHVWAPVDMDLEYIQLDAVRTSGPLIDGKLTDLVVRLGPQAIAAPVVDLMWGFEFHVAFDPAGPGLGRPVQQYLGFLIDRTENSLESFRPVFP